MADRIGNAAHLRVVAVLGLINTITCNLLRGSYSTINASLSTVIYPSKGVRCGKW